MRNKSPNLSQLKTLYDQGKNIIDELKKHSPHSENTVDAIQLSYDLQAGTYLQYRNDHLESSERWTGAVAAQLDKLKLKNSQYNLLEVGVGEATTLASVVQKLIKKPSRALGFDISWSRLAVARHFITSLGVTVPIDLFMADLFHIPLSDDSVDVVYTAHSLEPNGGKEILALRELYRVARQYVVLLEPAYELATSEGKARMKKNGYIVGLQKAISKLGYEVVEHRLFDYSTNELNPTGLTVIKKQTSKPGSHQKRMKSSVLYCDPLSGEQLELLGGAYFSKKGLVTYPIIGGIPCLVQKHAVITTQYSLWTD